MINNLGIIFVRAQCSSYYRSCPPHPSCYTIPHASVKCVELTYGIQSTIFDQFTDYIVLDQNPGLYGYNSLTCSISSQDSGCSQFGLNIDPNGRLYANPTIGNNPETQCNIQITCTFYWWWDDGCSGCVCYGSCSSYYYSNYYDNYYSSYIYTYSGYYDYSYYYGYYYGYYYDYGGGVRRRLKSNQRKLNQYQYNQCAQSSLTSQQLTIKNTCGSTCRPINECASNSFDHTGSVNYNGFSVNQYSGTSNTNIQTPIPLSEFFTFPCECNFQSCNLVPSQSEGSYSGYVSAILAGSGSSATVQFRIQTDTIQSNPYYLSCAVSACSDGTTYSFSTMYKYSSFTIRFDVIITCSYSASTPSDISYNYQSGTQSQNIDFSLYITPQPSSCTLTNCDMIVVSSTRPSQITLILQSGTTYTVQVDTSSSFTNQQLVMKCFDAGGVNAFQSNPFYFQIVDAGTCSLSTCDPSNYSQLSAASSSYSAYQFQGTSNQLTVGQLPISQFFSIPDASCSFTSCNFAQLGSSSSQGAVSSLGTASYSGSGSSATVDFILNTASITNENVYLSCLIPAISASSGICAASQYYIYSSNSISLNILSCYTVKTPVSYSRTQTSGSESISVDSSTFIQQTDAVDCPLSSCQVIDQSTSSAATFLTFSIVSGTSYNLVLTTSNVVSSTLFYRCSVNGGLTLNSNSFTISITSTACTPSVCQSGTYTYTGTTSPSSYTSYQYSGTSNQVTQSSVQITQYFSIPDSSCSFQSCQLVSTTGSSTAQGSVFVSVTATYSGTGSTASIVFQMDTSTYYSATPLYLSCTVPAAAASGSTCAINQFFVYSSNSITFSVNQCYTALAHSALSYSEAAGITQTWTEPATNFISQLDSTNCPLTDCKIVDSSSQAVTSYFTISLSSGLTYNFNLNVNTALTATLQFQCTGNGGISQSSSNFQLTISACVPSVCQSGSYSFTGTSSPSTFNAYQNFGTLSSGQFILSQTSVSLSQYFNFPDTTCSFSSCLLVSAIGTSSTQGTLVPQIMAVTSGTGSAQQVTFHMNTNNAFSGSLYLSCTVAAAAASGSTCAISQFYVYSHNSITFTVQNCYTAQTPASIWLYQNQGGGSYSFSIDQSTIMTTIDSTCPLSCSLVSMPTGLSLSSTSGTIYNYLANTLSPVSVTTLQFTCQGSGASYQSNTFQYEITACIPSTCASGYSFAGTSIPSSFSVYQYSGTSNSNVQSAISISQYFTMPSTCTFTSCSLVQTIGTSTIQGTLSSMVSSTFSANQVQFAIDTSGAQSQSLFLSCIVPSAPVSGSTCALSQFYVYSSNQITFNVVNCYTPQTPASYTYSQYYLGGAVSLQIQVSSFITQSDVACPLSNCAVVSSTGSPASSMTLTSLTSTSYQLDMDTSLPVLQQSQFYQCQGYGGNVISNPFTFEVGFTCISSSTTIKAPSSMKNTYYIINQPGTLSSITISNFTSTNTGCPIILHQLVVSSGSTTSPSYVQIQQGLTEFVISNKSMAWLASIYTFQIYVQAQGGATLYQPITIQVMNDCGLDSIFINPTFPGNQEQMPTAYKAVNSLPVLFLNTTTASPLSVDISKRIANIFKTSCPLIQFQISKASINSQIVDISTFGSYYTLSSNGVFQTLSTAPSSIYGSQVYIQANNKQIWGGDSQQYLIDVTIIQIQTNSSTNSTSQTQTANSTSTDSAIASSNETSTQASHDSSNATNDHSNGQQSSSSTQTQSSGSSTSSSASKSNQASQTKSNKNKISTNSNFVPKFKKPKNQNTNNQDSSQGNGTNNSTKVQILPVYFDKISIDKKGLMQIKFNQELKVPDFIKYINDLKKNSSQLGKLFQNQSQESYFNQQIKKANLSLNQSYSDFLSLQNIMEFGLTVNSLQDQSVLDFKIKLLDWTNYGMSIFLNFTNPTLVSTGSKFDVINTFVLNGNHFTSANGLIPLIEYESGFNQTGIPAQQPSFISAQLMDSIQSNSQALTISIIVIQVGSQVLMKTNMELLYKLFLNMQLQQSLPIYQVNILFKSQLYIDTLRSIVEFEFLKPQSLIKKAGFDINLVKSDKNAPANLKRLGMTSSNILDNMMTYLFMLGLAVAFLIILSMFFIFPCLRQKIQQFITDKIKKLKWNGLMRGLTVSYLKLCVGLSLQGQQQRKNIKDVEITQAIQQICLLVFLVGYIFFAQIKLSLNFKNFKDDKFQKEYGFLVRGQKILRFNIGGGDKTPNMNTIFIYPCFLLYRLVYSMVPLIFLDQPGVQVQILIILTLAYIYVLISLKTQISQVEYYVDMYFEFMLLMMQLHMFWFMDGGVLNGTPNSVSQADYLWFQGVADSSFMACGLSITFVGLANFGNYTVHQLINLFYKQKNLYNHKKQLEQQQNQDQQNDEKVKVKTKDQIVEKILNKLKENTKQEPQKEFDVIQIEQQQHNTTENYNLQEIRKQNFKEIKSMIKNSQSIQFQQKPKSIKNKLPLIHASTKLKKLIKNPKIVNNMSLMSEIEENKSNDENSIQDQNLDQQDIDMIELQNLTAICQNYENIFNTSQYKMKVHENMKVTRELILQKYSVLSTDTAEQIDSKMQQLHVDVLSNIHLLKKLSDPLSISKQFQRDTKQYYQNKIYDLIKS